MNIRPVIQDQLTRSIRAYLADIDGDPTGVPTGQCQTCQNVLTRDMLLANQGTGYLCPTCADALLIQLRRKVARRDYTIQRLKTQLAQMPAKARPSRTKTRRRAG